MGQEQLASVNELLLEGRQLKAVSRFVTTIDSSHFYKLSLYARGQQVKQTACFRGFRRTEINGLKIESCVEKRRL